MPGEQMIGKTNPTPVPYRNPYYVRQRQDWAVEQERMRHNQALYTIGEWCVFVLMWHITDFEKGLVNRCPTCWNQYGRTEAFQQKGVVHTRELTVESTPDFRIQNGDYVFRVDNARFRLRTPSRVTLRSGFGHPWQNQTGLTYNHSRAGLEDPSAVAYTIPPQAESLRGLLNISPESPADFSNFEVIRAPLIPADED